MKRTSTALLTAVLGASLGLAGCDFREFDNLSDETWVDSSKAPGALDSDEYGTAIAFGGTTNTDGTTFVVAGSRPDGVGQVSYLSNGSLETGGLLVSGVNPDATPLSGRPALAGDPRNPDGVVGLGIGIASGNVGSVILATPDGLAALPPAGTSSPVEALAFGRTVDMATPDLVALHGGDITLVGNYVMAPNLRNVNTCTIGRDAGFAVAVADFDTGTAGEEIVAAVGNSDFQNAASVVQITSATQITAGNMGNCFEAGTRDPLATITPPGMEPDFGKAMVVGDFDGNGTPDLAIGAPSANKVYVYMNIALPTAPAAPVEVTVSGSTAFGESLAVGDFDGDGNHELVVGDPNATVDGTANAGMVHLFTQSGGSFTAESNALHDAQPEGDQRFGRSIAVAKFGGAQDILVVAASGEVFTYFRNSISGSDVRD